MNTLLIAVASFVGFIVAYHTYGRWLASKISITPFRAFSTKAVLVLIFIPSAAGIAHEAIGFGAFSNSTKHILQFPAIDNFS